MLATKKYCDRLTPLNVECFVERNSMLSRTNPSITRMGMLKFGSLGKS